MNNPVETITVALIVVVAAAYLAGRYLLKKRQARQAGSCGGSCGCSASKPKLRQTDKPREVKASPRALFKRPRPAKARSTTPLNYGLREDRLSFFVCPSYTGPGGGIGRHA